MDDNAELESFRRQWREEVARRTKQSNVAASQTASKTSAAAVAAATSPSGGPHYERFPPTRREAASRKEVVEDDDDNEASTSYDTGEIVHQVGQLSLNHADADGFDPRQHPPKEPKSALEHFERAVQKEAEGNLGDSLSHYRKAYRLDSAVDKTYRNKHFAHSWKPRQPSSAQVPAPASQPTSQAQGEDVRLPTPSLIESFAHLPIPQAEPLIENTPPPPCPIAHVPSEVLVEILKHVALMDPASFYRMSLACKRFAYHFAHEQHIWKRLCQGAEFGFLAMQYSFSCDIYGKPMHTLGPRYTPFPAGSPVQIPKPLSTWSQVFQTFPRIRFTGIYISTVNYTRPGAASSYQNITWNSPIHIVTYYRFLRFYPDGTVISLLSTTEPMDVVPHISKENMVAARATLASQRHHQRHVSDTGVTLSGASDPVPPVAMSALKYALRGRWHLTPPSGVSDTTSVDSKPDGPSDCPPPRSEATLAVSSDMRDLVVETEGVDPKYVYTMHLSLRSSSSSAAKAAGHSHVAPPNAAKNTKLIWRGFWSYNKLTDDWAEFGLRNDKPYVFRRVRGWGMN